MFERQYVVVCLVCLARDDITNKQNNFYQSDRYNCESFGPYGGQINAIRAGLDLVIQI